MMQRWRKGLTLIEVMLAMTIGALVVLMVFGVLTTALDARGAIEASNRAGRVSTAIFNQIARDLAAAYLYRDVEDGFVGQEGGGADRFDFISLTPSSIEMGEVASQPTEVGYQVRPIPGHAYQRLYRREGFYTDSKPTRGGELIPLYDGIFNFRVSYHDGESWITIFTNQKVLPRLVKVKLGIWVGEGTPESRDQTKEYSYTQTFSVPAEGLTFDLEPPEEEEGERGGLGGGLGGG